MTTATPRRLAAAVAAVLVVTSCAGDDQPATDPGVTFDTVPTDDASDDAAADDSPADDSVPATAAGTDPDDGADTTTSSLTPDPDADLPSAPPPDGDAASTITTLPGPLAPPSVQLVEVGTFTQPVEIASRPLDNRLFVVEQAGRVIAADDLSSEVVLDIVPLVESGGERGLLGLAFHPELDLAYVHYSGDAGRTTVAEYAIDPLSGAFDTSTARIVLTVDQPFSNHNGGELAFGPDGLLYLGLGDGGSADDPRRTALDLTSRLGKILRIDPLENGDEPFLVPPDNPFVDTRLGEAPDAPAADPTIWSVGLRNPWKFSFDSLTGDLWIADVGQNRWEEIDLAPATDGRAAGRGLNFGWSAWEGVERFNDDQSPDGHTPPAHVYPHDDGNCSVSGGAVARSSANVGLHGWYVFGDFCSGRLWALDTTSVGGGVGGGVGGADAAPVVIEIGQVPSLVAVVEGPEGDLFAVSGAGPVLRLDAA